MLITSRKAPKSQKSFSWENNRSSVDRRSAHIDRVYISSLLCGQGGVITIHLHKKISDHMHLEFQLFCLTKSTIYKKPMQINILEN